MYESLNTKLIGWSGSRTTEKLEWNSSYAGVECDAIIFWEENYRTMVNSGEERI